MILVDPTQSCGKESVLDVVMNFVHPRGTTFVFHANDLIMGLIIAQTVAERKIKEPNDVPVVLGFFVGELVPVGG